MNKSRKIIVPLVAGLLVVAFLPAYSAFAWGPDRTPLDWSKPADYPVINTMGNNPTLGDERTNFVQVSEAGKQEYKERMSLEAGKEYEAYIYFHNNASALLNDSGIAMANNVRMGVIMPAKLNAGEVAEISATITSTNTTPAAVWDEAYIVSTEQVYLRYVPGSAVIHSKGSVNGSNLPANDLFSTGGTPIGYSANYWGSLAGCNEYAGYVTYRFVVDKPGFEMDKKVAKADEGNWDKSVVIAPGESVDFKIRYKNTGTTEQNNVGMMDSLPAGLSYAGVMRLMVNGAQVTPSGNAKADEDLFANGLNIGRYQPQSEAELIYRVSAPAEKDLACGDNKFKNHAMLVTADGTLEDEAEVIVRKNCTPGELPKTGPAEVAMAVVAVLCVGVGGTYWYRSRKMLRRVSDDVEGKE